MVRVGERVDQFQVAGGAAAVFRRAGTSAVGAGRVSPGRLGGYQFLQPYLVCPAVAEVVLVPERVSLAGGQVAERGLAFVRVRSTTCRKAGADAAAAARSSPDIRVPISWPAAMGREG